MENMNCEAADILTWYCELVSYALATNGCSTWHRRVLLCIAVKIIRYWTDMWKNSPVLPSIKLL